MYYKNWMAEDFPSALLSCFSLSLSLPENAEWLMITWLASDFRSFRERCYFYYKYNFSSRNFTFPWRYSFSHSEYMVRRGGDGANKRKRREVERRTKEEVIWTNFARYFGLVSHSHRLLLTLSRLDVFFAFLLMIGKAAWLSAREWECGRDNWANAYTLRINYYVEVVCFFIGKLLWRGAEFAFLSTRLLTPFTRWNSFPLSVSGRRSN